MPGKDAGGHAIAPDANKLIEFGGGVTLDVTGKLAAGGVQQQIAGVPLGEIAYRAGVHHRKRVPHQRDPGQLGRGDAESAARKATGHS